VIMEAAWDKSTVAGSELQIVETGHSTKVEFVFRACFGRYTPGTDVA
jgi:hypothetical protein